MENPIGPRALETRKKIIDTALGLIIEHGDEGITMTDICQALDISRTTMYRHFRGMDEIIENVYENVRITFSEGLKNAIEETPEAEKRLDVVVDYLYTFFLSGRGEKLGQLDPKFLRKLSLVNFDSRIELYKKSLEPFFDLAEKEKGSKVDRNLVAYFIAHFYGSLTVYGEHSKPYEINILLRKLIVGLTFENHTGG